MKTDTIQEASPRPCATAMRGLRQRRRAAGMKLYEAAQAMGVTRQTFANWEAGTSVPGGNLLARLSAMFGCTVGELFDGEEEPVQLTIDASDAGKEDPDDRSADEG